MKVRALRGVCVGVDRHLRAGDTADVDDASVQFLASIGAVEIVKDEPAPVPVEVQKPAPAPAKKSGKKET
jgi:hypothetical protein